jgi:hypothetical protein
VPSYALDSVDQGARGYSGTASTLLWVHVAIALLILAISWRMHAVVRPYEYAIQNSIENLLFASDMAVVALGALYTMLRVNGVASTCSCMGLLEGIMLALLCGAVLLAIAWVTRAYFKRTDEETQLERDAEVERCKAEQRQTQARIQHLVPQRRRAQTEPISPHRRGSLQELTSAVSEELEERSAPSPVRRKVSRAYNEAAVHVGRLQERSEGEC